MISIYVIRSLSNQSLYVGMSQDVNMRLKEHNNKKSKYTSAFTPWEIVYVEESVDWKTGRAREKYLKSTAGKDWLRKMGYI